MHRRNMPSAEPNNRVCFHFWSGIWKCLRHSLHVYITCICHIFRLCIVKIHAMAELPSHSSILHKSPSSPSYVHVSCLYCFNPLSHILYFHPLKFLLSTCIVSGQRIMISVEPLLYHISSNYSTLDMILKVVNTVSSVYIVWSTDYASSSFELQTDTIPTWKRETSCTRIHNCIPPREIIMQFTRSRVIANRLALGFG